MALFSNTGWTKNQHLITGEAATLVADAYEKAHLLDQRTLAATHEELDEHETPERQEAKKVVDAAAATAVRELRDLSTPSRAITAR